MEVSTQTAIIGACVTLVVAYLTGFLSDKYKRHYEGSAIAAGLAGELASYEEPMHQLRRGFALVISMIDVDQKFPLPLREIERPKDKFYEAVIGRIGILGPDLVGEVVYVYGLIGGFRVGMEVLSKHHGTMPIQEVRARLEQLILTMDKAWARAQPLLPLLKQRAGKGFLPE